MELSARVEYALLALLEMVDRYAQRQPLKIGEITANQAIPDRYLEQILINLRRNGVVQSQRGAKGGYLLAREPWQITILEIVQSVEGDPGRKSVDRTTLEQDLVREVWEQASVASQSVLTRYTLQDLHQRCEARRQINPMYYI